MPSLREARSLAEQLRARADELVDALDGDVDFREVVRLADELGASADRLASTFEAVDAALVDAVQRLTEGGRDSKPDGQRRGRANGSSASKETLYKRARRARIPGRSDMSKDELERALERAAADRRRQTTRGVEE